MDNKAKRVRSINPYDRDINFGEFIKRSIICEKYGIDLSDLWDTWNTKLVDRYVKSDVLRGPAILIGDAEGFVYKIFTSYELTVDEAAHALKQHDKVYKKPDYDYYVVTSVVLNAVYYHNADAAAIKGHEPRSNLLKLYYKVGTETSLEQI